MPVSTFELMNIQFDDNTDREDLIAIINDLDEERKNLHDRFDDEAGAAEELRDRMNAQEDRLAEAADLMADLGKIHNTPKAKADWMVGE